MRLVSGLLFSHGEENTSRILRRFYCNKPFVVYKEVALSQVIRANKGEMALREWGFYTRASLDFLVCRDDETQAPELALEFDSGFHDTPEQTRRDSVKNSICATAGLPLIRVRSEQVLEREGYSLLEYMLQLHYGERAVQEQVRAGTLSWDEEYFPGVSFDGIPTIENRLLALGMFPAGLALLAPEHEREAISWYRILAGGSKNHIPSRQGHDIGAVRIEALHGFSAPKLLFAAEKTVQLRDCTPGQSILGIPGWHLAQEFAVFICLQEVERRFRSELAPRA